MTSRTHRIVRPVVDVQVRSAQGSDVLDRVRTLWNDVCVPALEAAFDEMAGDEVVRIDRLEVDLGTLPLESLSTSLAERLQQATIEALEATLRGRTSTTEVPPWQQVLPLPVRDALRTLPSSLASEQTRRLETLAHLVVTGRRAWWDPAEIDLDRVVQRLLDEAPEACVNLLRSVSHDLAGTRLARQLSPNTRDRLCHQLGPEALADTAQAWTTALAVLHPERDSAGLENVAWTAVLTVALGASRTVSVETLRTRIDEHAARRSAALVGTHVDVWKARAVREAAAALPPSVPAEDWANAGRAADEDETEASAEPPDREKPDADAPLRRDERSRGPGPSPKPDRLARHGEPGMDGVQVPRDASGDGLPTSPDAPAPHRDSSSLPAGTEASEPVGPDDAAGGSPSEAVYVDDAGLVLLAPFLASYFETLGLTRDGAFPDAEAHGRAVLLTRFLATGALDAPEPSLVLAALLCGWPATEPLPRRLTPTEVELEESTILLESVVEHWAVLKNTSVDGLRRTFLLREGTLERQPRQWHLTVDRRGVDVLLESLPWGISVVSLPWMPTPLFVSW